MPELVQAILGRYGPVVPSRVNPSCPCVVTPLEHAEARLDEVRRALPPGLVAFQGAGSDVRHWVTTRIDWFQEIAVGPGDDQWAILSLAATHCTTDHVLLEVLRDFDRRLGIDVRMAQRDMLLFHLKRLPDDLTAFVEELYALAPDPVDIGFTQTKEFWEEQIAGHHKVGLWWL